MTDEGMPAPGEFEWPEYTLTDTEPPDREADGYVAFCWERRFFYCFLLKYGTVVAAAEEAGVNEAIVNARCKESPEFLRRLELCRERLRDMVRSEIFRRAVEPIEKPIFSRGKIIGYVQEWDTLHLRWLAERLMPSEFHLPSIAEAASERHGDMEFKMEIAPPRRPGLKSGEE